MARNGAAGKSQAIGVTLIVSVVELIIGKCLRHFTYFHEFSS
jgi:hypothetical protein